MNHPSGLVDVPGDIRINSQQTSRPLSAVLRERTRVAHADCERAFALDRRLADRAAYGALLVLLRDFYLPVENALATVVGWDRLTPAINIRSRRRAELIETDLAALDGTVAAGRPAATGAQFPALGSMAEALGCLYVIEGSALGGRIIARRVRTALGSDLPVAFFSSADRGDPGGDWNALRAALDAFGAEQGPSAARAAVAGAHLSFAALRVRLDLEDTSR
jgi:heme oxygenase